MRNLLIATCLFVSCSSHAQIVLGQVDDFQDGTLMNWSGGASMSNQPNGGPGGAGDRFLQIESFGGNGGGSRLAAFNGVQWAGDYQAAGVTAVSVMLKNLGQTTLAMRLVLFEFDFGQTRWTSTVSQTLAPGGGWQLMTFSVAEADLTQVMGTTSYNGVITGVDRMMIRHQAGAPDAEGDAIVATMGMDNVRAVPEPASLVALGVGGVLLRLRRRRPTV